MGGRRPGMPTVKSIARHHGRKVECWRCGFDGGVQRCHVVAARHGGAHTAENLMLLCEKCHKEQPDQLPPELQWEWLRDTSEKARWDRLADEAALASRLAEGVNALIEEFGREWLVPYMESGQQRRDLDIALRAPSLDAAEWSVLRLTRQYAAEFTAKEHAHAAR